MSEPRTAEARLRHWRTCEDCGGLLVYDKADVDKLLTGSAQAPETPPDITGKLRWTHQMMQEFVIEAQQHLTAGRTSTSAQMFEQRLVQLPRDNALFRRYEQDREQDEVFCDVCQRLRDAVRAAIEQYDVPPESTNNRLKAMLRDLRAALLSEPQAAQEPKWPYTIRSLAEYLGWGYKSDEETWKFAAERERLLRGTMSLLETHMSDAPTAELAIKERIARISASPVLPAPPEAGKEWEPFAPTETDCSTTNSGDVGGSRTDR